MRYLNQYYIGCILVIFVLIVVSCEGQLNKAPLDKPSNKSFFSNKKQLKLAINGAYHQLWWGSKPMPVLLDNGTDEGFERQNQNGHHAISVGTADPETGAFESTWKHMYQGVSRCNILLKRMTKAKNKVSENFYKKIQGQARFLRAWYYFWLVELYGDVPLVTKVLTLEKGDNLAQTPKDSVIAQMFRDLDFAAKNLPSSWPGNDKGRATKGAALTLKARTALLNGKFSVAATSAKKVMDMGVYSLYPDYEQLFQYKGKRSKGVIFDEPFKIGVRTSSLSVQLGPRNPSGYSIYVPSQFMVDMYEASDGLPIDKSPLYDPTHPFRNRDPRLDASIIRPGSKFAGYYFYTHPDSTKTTYIKNGQKKRVTNQDVTNPYATFTGYCWRKYDALEDFQKNQQKTSELNFIYMRYAEALLTYAEAKIEMDDIDQSVLDVINKVRARAYGVNPSQTSKYPAITTTDQDKLRKKVRYERTVEFANEGLRFFDIRRWDIGKDVKDGPLIGRPKGAYKTIPHAPSIDKNGHPHYDGMRNLYRIVEHRTFTKKNYWWAIPQSEIDVDDNLTQNPGY
jgi:hypothetical protein